MKIVSWNVNGLRAVLNKDFINILKDVKADIFCIQETKLQEKDIPDDLNKMITYWHHAEKKGYSGTLCICKKEPISVKYGINNINFDKEGRTITLEYDDFYIVNAYVPNAQHELKRLEYRMSFEKALLKHLVKLDKNKPVIYCGDLNVAHEEIDLKNPKTNHGNPGFSDEEREMMTELLSNGFKDVYRELYPDKQEFTWWSYRMNARAKNIGWRIDYFIVSERLFPKVKDMKIRNDIYGSDHCPIELIL